MTQKKVKHPNIIRWVMLGLILGVSMLTHYLHAIGGATFPSVHAICPYGGIENLWAWIAGRANIQKIFSGTMALFFLTVVFALILGRSFCGNICPFGALQDFVGFLFPRKYKVPQKIDKPLRYTKYVILALSILMAWITATLWISPFDPWAAFAHIYSGEEIWVEFPIGTVVLIITIAASLFISRFFCKYLCPAGALYGLLGKISPLKVERDTKTCVNCGSCTKSCPMDIEVDKCEKVTSLECINCGMCVNTCPQPGKMIAVKASGRTFKTSAVVIASVVIFFGVIFMLDRANLYRVALPTQVEVQQKGQYIRVADLRGSMTIEQGAIYTGMKLEEFYKLMEIPQSVPKETPLKEVSLYVKDYDFHAIKAKKALE